MTVLLSPDEQRYLDRRFGSDREGRLSDALHLLILDARRRDRMQAADLQRASQPRDLRLHRAVEQAKARHMRKLAKLGGAACHTS